MGNCSMLEFDENLVWLLLAELTLNTNKSGCLETASSYIKKRTDYITTTNGATINESRCLEILGMENENSGNMNQALKLYKSAYECCANKSLVPPQLVYRFANCLLQNDQIVDCIVVCNDCLKTCPSYVRLGADILS